MIIKSGKEYTINYSMYCLPKYQQVITVSLMFILGTSFIWWWRLYIIYNDMLNMYTYVGTYQLVVQENQCYICISWKLMRYICMCFSHIIISLYLITFYCVLFFLIKNYYKNLIKIRWWFFLYDFFFLTLRSVVLNRLTLSFKDWKIYKMPV